MYQFPIGVMVDSFRCEMHEAIRRAAGIGAKGLQMYATRGNYAPENLTPAARRELLNFVKSQGLVFSALCGDLGKGFAHPELNPALIEKSKRILDLAVELETNVVTTHIGVVPEDKNAKPMPLCRLPVRNWLPMLTVWARISPSRPVQNRQLPFALFSIHWIQPA